MGSVLDIKETWKAGGGWQSEDGIKGSTQWVRTFTVTVSNTPTMCYAADVLSHRGIPKSGSSHPASPWFRCRSAKAKRVSPIMFEVECTYKSKTKDKDHRHRHRHRLALEYKRAFVNRSRTLTATQLTPKQANRFNNCPPLDHVYRWPVIVS